MSGLRISLYPEDEYDLRQVCQPVREPEDYRLLAMQMVDALPRWRALGVAANQVGLRIALTVIRLPEHTSPYILFNPIVKTIGGGTQAGQEGCLSFPGMCGRVARASQLECTYLNMEGELRKIVADGLFARAIQHEVDHLHGTLFIDRMGSLTRKLLLQKYLRSRKEAL